IPVEDTLDPDRVPLRFAVRAFRTCRVYDVMRHIPETGLDTAARAVAANRRREVSEATMHRVREIATTPDPDVTHAERQQAVGKVVRDYRQSMVAGHLYPRSAGRQHGRDNNALTR